MPIRVKLQLGIVELATVLGSLDLLFLAFVVVQLPYFFGGTGLIEQPGTTTYAEYARRGFFELCAVAGLVLPLLLSSHWLLRRQDPRHERVFRVLAAAMAALVFVMIASALHRMRLYQAAYGLTELRLYTTAFMLWLTAVFGWFAWTVLRGRRERFAFGALAAGLEALVVLHAVNPDALIVRVNTRRMSAEVPFDARYAASLSADAVPALLAALPKLAPADRCLATERLLKRWDDAPADWREWSLGRGRARRAVSARERELRAVQCVPPGIIPPSTVTVPPPSPAPAATSSPAQNAPPAPLAPAAAGPGTPPDQAPSTTPAAAPSPASRP